MPRIINVTRLPSAENTCANSQATKPPPTITRCSGTSAIRMIVSLVWYGTPRVGDLVRDDRARTGGDHHLVGGELVAVVGAQRVAAVRQRRGEPGVASRTP